MNFFSFSHLFFFLAEASKKKNDSGSKKVTKRKATNKKKASQAGVVDYSNVNCGAKMLQVTTSEKKAEDYYSLLRQGSLCNMGPVLCLRARLVGVGLVQCEFPTMIIIFHVL